VSLFGTRFPMLPALLLPLGMGVVLRAEVPAPPGPERAEVSYAEDVVAILEKRCVRCHGGLDEGEIRIELSLNMTSYEGLMVGSEYGTIITPGDPDDSLIIEMISDGEMPDEGDPVPPEEIEIIRQWIAEGALNN
jgi:Planctomycete cytochrome C